MAKANTTTDARLTEAEIEHIFSKLSGIFVAIETVLDITGMGMIDRQEALRLGAGAKILAQVGGFIADHAGDDCSYYGDIFDWLDIPKGKGGES